MTNRILISQLAPISRFALTLATFVGSFAAPTFGQVTTTWDRTGNGNWHTGSNWTTGAPVANGTAILGNSITANADISVQGSSRSGGNITASNANFDYTISGNPGGQLNLSVTSGTPTIDVTSSARTLTISAPNGINATQGIAKTGAGTLVLSGASVYTGGSTLSAGTLRVGNVAALGSIDNTLTVNGGTLDLNNTSISVGNLTGTGGTITSNLAGSQTLTIGQGNGTGGDYQGVIAAGTGTTSLDKTGTGLITLSGANTYTGNTSISGGTLRVNGSHTGGGNYTVASSATLGGTGSTASALSIAGTLSPGAGGVETFGSGAASFTDLSAFAYEVDSSVALGVGADLLVANGDLNLTGNVSLSLADIAGAPAAFAEGTTFTLVNYGGSWNSGLFRVAGVDIADGDTFTVGLNTWQLDYDATSGGSNFSGQYAYANYVNIVAVPEPPMVAMLAAGSLIGLLVYRRKRS